MLCIEELEAYFFLFSFFNTAQQDLFLWNETMERKAKIVS